MKRLRMEKIVALLSLISLFMYSFIKAGYTPIMILGIMIIMINSFMLDSMRIGVTVRSNKSSMNVFCMFLVLKS